MPRMRRRKPPWPGARWLDPAGPSLDARAGGHIAGGKCSFRQPPASLKPRRDFGAQGRLAQPSPEAARTGWRRSWFLRHAPDGREKKLERQGRCSKRIVHLGDVSPISSRATPELFPTRPPKKIGCWRRGPRPLRMPAEGACATTPCRQRPAQGAPGGAERQAVPAGGPVGGCLGGAAGDLQAGCGRRPTIRRPACTLLETDLPAPQHDHAF